MHSSWNWSKFNTSACSLQSLEYKILPSSAHSFVANSSGLLSGSEISHSNWSIREMLPTWMFNWNTQFTARMNHWLTIQLTSRQTLWVQRYIDCMWTWNQDNIIIYHTSLLFKLWSSMLWVQRQQQHCAHHNHNNIPASETWQTLISFIDYKMEIKQNWSSIQWFHFFPNIIELLMYFTSPQHHLAKGLWNATETEQE